MQPFVFVFSSYSDTSHGLLCFALGFGNFANPHCLSRENPPNNEDICSEQENKFYLTLKSATYYNLWLMVKYQRENKGKKLLKTQLLRKDRLWKTLLCFTFMFLCSWCLMLSHKFFSKLKHRDTYGSALSKAAKYEKALDWRLSKSIQKLLNRCVAL